MKGTPWKIYILAAIATKWNGLSSTRSGFTWCWLDDMELRGDQVAWCDDVEKSRSDSQGCWSVWLELDNRAKKEEEASPYHRPVVLKESDWPAVNVTDPGFVLSYWVFLFFLFF